MSKTIELHCELGNHEWSRESQRGRRPVNCPEHQPVIEETEKKVSLNQIISGEARAKAINDIVSIHPECKCDIRDDMTDDELMHVKSCAPHWQCSTLDAVRRRVVNYNRHFDQDDYEVSL
jgi:hypothetical protein